MNPIDANTLVAQPQVASPMDLQFSAQLDNFSLIGFNAILSSHLLLNTPAEFFSTPIPPLKTQVAVPFQWEEAPGKPKLCAHLTPHQFPPSLQPPPGHVHRLDTSPLSLDRSHSSHGLWTFSLPGVQDHGAPKVSKTKSFWQKLIVPRKVEDPWSPTSTLLGPEPGKRSLFPSFSSLSFSSVPDLSSTYSPVSFEVQRGQQSTLRDDDDSDVDYSFPLRPDVLSRQWRRINENHVRNQLKKRASESMRSILKLWRIALKWRHAKTQQKRIFTETEMWAPTLATYFHSMEIEDVSNGDKQLMHKGSQETSSENNSDLSSSEIDVRVQP